MLFAWPDANRERNLFEIRLPPPFGSLIDSSSLSSREIGIGSIPRADRPPVLIPFFAFRVMVGCGLIMLALAWAGSFLPWRGSLDRRRWLLWPVFLSFPLAWGWKQRRDRWLFPCGAVVPFTVTIEQAAAPASSLAFMFWGAGIIILPLTLAYTAAVYFIFRGRVTDGEHALGHLSTRLPADVPTTEAGKLLHGVLSVLPVLSLVRDVIRQPRRSRDASGGKG